MAKTKKTKKQIEKEKAIKALKQRMRYLEKTQGLHKVDIPNLKDMSIKQIKSLKGESLKEKMEFEFKPHAWGEIEKGSGALMKEFLEAQAKARKMAKLYGAKGYEFDITATSEEGLRKAIEGAKRGATREYWQKRATFTTDNYFTSLERAGADDELALAMKLLRKEKGDIWMARKIGEGIHTDKMTPAIFFGSDKNLFEQKKTTILNAFGISNIREYLWKNRNKIEGEVVDGETLTKEKIFDEYTPIVSKPRTRGNKYGKTSK